MSTSVPTFIGKDALTHIAETFMPQIIMGAAYYNPAEMERLGIKVISGVQFKHTKVIMARKGGTTRRKVVGQTNFNTIGFLKERELVAKLTWNQFMDNIDSYTETPYHADGSQDYSYPLSEVAFQAITATYGEDLFNNLFFGAIDNENVEGKESLSLFDGYHTLIARDIEDGIISEAVGNLVDCGALTRPVSETDTTAWDSFVAWQLQWHAGLKAKEVRVLCSVEVGLAITEAYENKHRSHKNVTVKPNGNFVVADYPRIEFAPSDVYGKGERLIATVVGNLEYGVDSENAKNSVSVEVGGHMDHKNVSFQIESIQGARLFNPLPSAFCMSDGAISECIVSGDYTSARVIVTAENDEQGSVTVNGKTPDNTTDYAPNTTLTLVATPAAGYTFKNWSDGDTNATRTIVTNGLVDMAYTAIFQAE